MPHITAFKKIPNLVSLICLIAVVILSFYFYANFPESVATHWNISGMADGYSPKAFAAFFFPALIIAVYILMAFMPSIDPHRDRYKEFAGAYSIFTMSLVLFLTVVYIAVGLNGLGYPVSVGFIMPLLVGALFAVIGYYMSEIKGNWFVGFRTPWTLSSDEVWKKTHKLAGALFMWGGALIFLSAFLSPFFKALFLAAVLLCVVLVPTVYSYRVFKEIRDRK